MRNDPTDKWCVYKTSHPLGFYYIGKGITKKVLCGAYKGSGTKLKAAFLHHPSNEWTSVVLETFPEEPLIGKKDPGEKKAYAREAELVHFDVITDPFCLNSMAGGNGGWKWKQLSAASVRKRAKSISDSLKGKTRGPQKQSTVDKRTATLRTPEVAAKLGHGKGKTFPGLGEKIAASLVEKGTHEKIPCPLCRKSLSKAHMTRHQIKCALRPTDEEIREKRHAANVQRSIKSSGSNNGTAIEIFVDGQRFGCAKEATAAFGFKYFYQLVNNHDVRSADWKFVYQNRTVHKVSL